MYYNDYLRNLKSCPFCNFKKEQIIKETSLAIFTISKSPYSKDHLLIFPKRHIAKLDSMKKEEKIEVQELIDFGIKLIKKQYNNFTVIYREGPNSGKSIEHLHYHIIPDKIIGVFDINEQKRIIFSDETYNRKIKEFTNAFLSS